MSVTLRVAEVGRKDTTSNTWDAFAKICGASFRCCYKALIIWQLEGHLLFRMRRFEIYTAEDSHKIGQCAIGIGLSLNVFADSLQLLPQYQCLWADVMMAILAKVGPGSYRYGSQWNIEPPREQVLGQLDGVKITSVDPFILQAIDFSRWTSWDEYLRQVSKNARRNADRALKDCPTLQVRTRQGRATLLDLPVLAILHLSMTRRKQLATSPIRLPVRLLLRMMTMSDHVITAVVTDRKLDLAVFSSVEFGANTYYLTGGSTRKNGGAAWHLLLTMIHRAYDRAPATGKFVMGSRQEQSPGWINLARSRDQCRVSNFATSVILFRFTPLTRSRPLPNQERP